MLREGIDFSGTRPTAEALRAAGKDFVVRYARSFTHPKSITATERLYWSANGVDVAIVEESTADRALDGRTAGQADAKAARAAIVAIGGPADGVIYSAVDFDATPTQMPAVLDYVRGFADVLGRDRTGVYGSYDVVKAADQAGVCKYLWQTYAWSAGLIYPGNHLYQYRNAQTLGGVEVDFCRTLLADFGQWGAQTPTVEDDMFQDADRVKLNALYTQVIGAVGAGQTDFQGTVETILKTVQGTVNLVNTKTGALAAQVTDAKTATLTAVAAIPTGHLSDAEQTELATKISNAVAEAGIEIDSAALSQAVATDLAGRLEA